ncbi:MAG: hypothetical protein DCF28_13745 [Alphaproteobacteria bacterium]|nr:MAG: hypothetical protein DCF28_13745 [Alphaproteobacteria bacterium]
MTLGEWLNTMILDDEDDGVTPLPRRTHAAEAIDRRGRSRRLDDAYEADEGRYARAYERAAYREPAHNPARDEMFLRVAASVDAIAARLEAAERRSTMAIQGVDQAVAGLLRRIDNQDQDAATQAGRVDDIVDELREGTRRLRAFEKEVGPRTAEAFGKTETSIAAVTSRLYDIEERQRVSAVELRQRMDAVEKAAGQVPDGALSADAMAQISARLDIAQASTTEALKNLERTFSGLDYRLQTAETQVAMEGGRFEKLAETLTRQVEDGRKEIMRQVSEGRDAVLSRVDEKQADHVRRMDAVDADGRLARIERAVAAIDARADGVERRSVEAVDTMGREIVRIAQNLNGRIGSVERISATFDSEAITRDITARVDRDMSRFAQVIEQRLTRSDDQNALALEKLGGEITRISDRLADRIIQSERRSAQAVDDITRRLEESAERSDQRFERASGEMAERMRLSEERTVRLLGEARQRQGKRETASAPVAAPVSDPVVVEASSVAAFPAAVESDWRTAAFPAESFGPEDDGWTQAPLPSAPPVETVPGSVFFDQGLLPEAPFAQPEPVEPASEVVVPQMKSREPREATPTFGKANAFAGFGGADVSDALLQDPDDMFGAETEFVDEQTMRASMASAAAAGRAASTRSTIEAARAAMNAAPEVAPQIKRNVMRGGKSKLQERLDKQASRSNSTVRKALLASVISAAAVGGIYSTMRLTGLELTLEGFRGEDGILPMAAMALSPTLGSTPAVTAPETIALYETGLELLDAGDEAGLASLTEAANLGYAPAQLKLIGLYQTGEAGVPQDEVESRLWARRAAEGGDPRGMHAYGMYLYDGVGGERSRAEALNWLTRAADRGLVDSQFNAAKIYEAGDEGIDADQARALTWYMIAARSGDAQAEAAVDRLAPLVSTDALTRARTEADAFTAESFG